jgi:broad specificity phosphatase PhoE
MFIQPKSLTLIRHGESEGNVIAKMKSEGKKVSEDLLLNKGTHLFELTNLGVDQAIVAGEYLRAEGIVFDTYLVSQYLRAQKTFELVFPGKEPDEVRSDINEYDRGYDWLYPENLGELFPTELESKKLKSHHYRSIGGENMTDLDLRIRSFLIWISLYHADEDVVVVGHGGWIKSAWVILTGYPRPDWDVPNASIMTFTRSQNGKKLEFRDLVEPEV